MLFEQMDFATFRNLAIALFIGALVGVEREHKHGADPWHFGGLRTFSLIATLGGAAGWLAGATGSWVPFVVAGLGIIAILVASYAVGAARAPDAGTTSEVAGLLVFVLGAVSGVGHPGVAVPLAIAAAALLAFEEPLHDAVRRMGADDLAAGLKLLFATFIVLPILPNRPIDPWEVLNPYGLWTLVVLISGISLVGYIAVRWFGPNRGTALTGFFSGLVSSTAATLAFARRSKDEPTLADALTAGVLLAWTVMFVRVIVETAIVNVAILAAVAIPMAAMAAAGALVAARAYLASPEGSESSAVPLRNPFRLTAAIQFAVMYALVLLVVAFARRYLPSEALYLVAAVAGTTDVDAITLSMAAAARDAADPAVYVQAIVIAAVSNTLVKFGMIAAIGDRGLRRRVGVGTVVVVLVGLGAVVALAFFPVAEGVDQLVDQVLDTDGPAGR